MKTALAAPLALLLSSAAAFAQQAGDNAFVLDEVVVSAGRVPVDVQSYARASTILTADEIERSQPKTVLDALRQVPGIHVTRSGSLGDISEVRIRGSEANHVLVLIDGVEAPDSSQGFDFNTLTPDGIERIEVLRGPQSALYGAGATAGVINIVTKAPIRDGVRGSLALEGGTHPSRAVIGTLQAGDDRGGIAFTASLRDDEGFDSSGSGGERDGIENLTLNLRGEADLAETLRLRGSVRFTAREVEFDSTAFGCGSSDCYVFDSPFGIEGHDFYTSLAADWDTLGGALVVTPRIAYSEDENRAGSAFGPSTNAASTLKIDPQAAYYFGARQQHALIGVTEFKRESFRSSFAGDDEKTRESLGFGVDYQGDVSDRLFVQGGLRYDRNEAFDDAISWAASASYALRETGTTLRASIGEGQTNPTFFEQFGFIPGEFTGNPDLKPERNFAWDVGVSQEVLRGRLRADLTYFNETLQDEIAGFGTTVDNLDGETEKQGIEAALTATPLPGLSVTASYTWLDAQEPSGLSEVRRPKHSGGVNVAYTFLEGRATVGADVTVFGDNRQLDFSDASFLSPSVRQEGHVTVDLSARFRLNERVEVYGAIKNLLDEEYEQIRGYRSQPLAAYLGVKARF